MAFYNTGIKISSPVLLCSVPKCGTYLIGGIMRSILGEALVEPSFEKNTTDTLFTSYNILPSKLQNRIYRGHFWYSDSFAELIGKIPKIILIRDPRDYVVSQAHFLNNIESAEHSLDYKFRSIKDWKIKLSIPIFGMKVSKRILPSVYDMFLNYGLKWMKSNNYLIVRYEDLISQSLEENSKVIDTVKRITNFLNIDIDYETIKERTFIGSDPSQSITFRSGRVGDWYHEFTSQHVTQFKIAAPNLVSSLGYEQNEDWNLDIHSTSHLDNLKSDIIDMTDVSIRKESYQKLLSSTESDELTKIINNWAFPILMKNGDFHMSIQILKSLLTSQKDNSELNYYMAFCLHMMKKYDEAIPYYNRALETGFDEFWVRYNRGSLYLTKGEIKKANEDISKAAILKPSHDGVISMIAQLKKHDANQV